MYLSISSPICEDAQEGMSGSGCKGYGFTHNVTSTNPSIDQRDARAHVHPADGDGGGNIVGLLLDDDCHTDV